MGKGMEEGEGGIRDVERGMGEMGGMKGKVRGGMI